MFLGFEDSLRDLKKEIKPLGVDMSYVKEWQKSYDKVRKQSGVLQTEYTKAKENLGTVYQILLDLEQGLIERKSDVSNMVLQLKQYQNAFNQEFLIGKEDRDFHLTYQSILNLGGKKVLAESDRLILQSEVENILAVIKEALEKNWPEFRALAYFYIEHSDKELFEFPHGEKVEMVNRIYKTTFYSPMYQILAQALGEVRAKKILEVDIWI